jgi:Tfp pilus assembly protein PilZ
VSLTLDLGLEDQIPFYRGFQNELRDGGLFIETGLKLAIGQAVEVEVTLNAAQTIKVEGLVAWCRDQCSEGELLRCGVGVYITNAGAAWSQLEQQFNAVEAIFYAA